MSQSARSMPLIAVPRTIPLPCQKCWRYMICQRYSTRVGSSPSSSGLMSSIAPRTARVCHSRVASPQPQRPGWSVTTLTKIQFRIRAWQTWVSMAVIRIEELRVACFVFRVKSTDPDTQHETRNTPSYPSPVHTKELAGDEVGQVAGEEEDGVGDVVGRAEAA